MEIGKKTVADWLEDIAEVEAELEDGMTQPEAIVKLLNMMKPVTRIVKLQQEQLEEQEDQIKGLWKRILDSGH